MPIASIETPFGRMGVEEQGGAIVAFHWRAEEISPATSLLREATQQLTAYFDNKLETFDLPLNPAGSSFELQVYASMSAIPKGETRSYGDLARQLDTQPQAIGQACGSNPIPVIIPCYRVVGRNGLGGFSGDGGVEMKIKLLKHERAYALLL